MRVKVVSLESNWRNVRIRLPLNTLSRNPGGVMFGGYQACLADPIAALACSRIFPGKHEYMYKQTYKHSIIQT